MRMRHAAAATGLALGLGLMLGSCTSFSDLVSDHWPHFAGGEPGGVPPRPGQPGYAQFIAHGQPSETDNAAVSGGQAVTGASDSPAGQSPVGGEQHTAIGVNGASAPQNAAGAGQTPTAIAAPIGAADNNVGQGGLY